MNVVEKYIERLAARIEAGSAEEADFEMKGAFPKGSDSQVLWQLADLLGSLANDPDIDGLRSLVYGPAKPLQRPDWLPDESALRNKLIRYFDGGVMPRIELFRRQLSDGREIDVFLIVERDETPYVTRHEPGGFPVVRVRTNTARRTANRAELLRLSRSRPSGSPVRKLQAKIEDHGKMKKLVVANVGTVTIRDIKILLPEGIDGRLVDAPQEGPIFPELRPTERDAVPFLSPMTLGASRDSFRVTVFGVAEDGETVSTEVLVSTWV